MVHVLFSCVHGGYLWIGNKVDMNVDPIHHITELSKTGKDPKTHISGKTKDSKQPATLVTKYKL